MKKISGRTVFTTLLSALVLIGLLLFVVQYFLTARTWVTFPGSPHVYSGGNISTGSIRDRTGTLLLTNSGARQYSDDLYIRKATMHLLGDRYGYVEAPLINTYADKLLSYNPITGVYDSSGTGNMMNLTLSARACVTALQGLGERKGTVGVYNYQTGEILCMVSSGTYDPDDMPSMEEIEGSDYYSGVFVNRFTFSTYVPGSVFKLVTAAAAIENIPDVFDRTFYCPKETIMGGEYITCEEYHGDISFGTGLVKSCNIVFGELAVELGADTLSRYARAAGIEEPISFDGTTVEPGHFDLTGANEPSIAWAGIGQYTDLINPCQFMTFVGSIANGGQAAAPYVVSSVETPAGFLVYRAEQTMLDRTLSPSTAQTLTEMMRDDVIYNYGTSNFPDLYVCAKSGTAETGEGLPNAMFAGFMQDSRYPLAFICIVESSGSGSDVCVPIVSSVLEACMADMQ